MIENDSQDKTNECPNTTEKTNVAPRAVGGDKLTPKNRGAEGEDGEDEDGDVLSTLRSRSDFRSGGQGSQFVDTGSDSSKSHSGYEMLDCFHREICNTWTYR